MVRGETNTDYVLTEDGIRVEKSPEYHMNSDNKRRVALSVGNLRMEDVAVGVVESVPRSCELSTVKGTTDEKVKWDINQGQHELQVRFDLAAGEECTVVYTFESLTESEFTTLCERAPHVERVVSVNDSTKAGSDYLSRSTRSPESNSLSDEQLVGDDHAHIDPPPDIDLSDVAGLHGVKEELKKEIIEPFTDPRFDEYDIGKANGVLFYGPPGTGKTHVATALAGELGYNFLNVDTGSLRSSKLGESQENIQNLFEMATAQQPCVVFFDEIDSIAPERDGDLHQARAEAVNELLQHVAAINEQDADVVVIAATNRPDRVDDALKRTGRFDTRIKIGMPDGMTRVAILEHKLEAFEGPADPVWMDSEFIDTFVEATTNFAASDVVEVVEAAERASIRRTEYDEPPRITQAILMDQLSVVDKKQQADTAGEFLTETPKIDFDDVGGMAETKARLEETLLDPLEEPGLYEEYGIEISNGVLLYGRPGTGKTYLSRALAGEAGCSFLPITASDIVSKWVGEAAQNIRELFEKAEQVAPAIVFIDEIDAIAGSRGGTQMTNTEEQAVNELLAQISDLDEQDVFVIGTTNRLDIIDDALTRAGRLGETIEVPPPDAAARIDILQKQLKDRPFDPNAIEWDELSLLSEPESESVPYVAADLAKIADEAARRAMAEADPDNIQPVTQTHLEDAIDAVDPSVPTDAHGIDSLT